MTQQLPIEVPELGWAPLRGSQTAFMQCPVFEVLYEGTRGPGKTDALLMDFAQDVGVGWGAEWRGILFRQTYPQLVDVISKSKKWFKRIFPEARFNEASTTWTWPSGEQLLLRHMKREDDYWNYHGHAYPWIGWEELTGWASDGCYKRMMSCSRSTVEGMPRRYRSTTNPYGVGHNWVKLRFRLGGNRRSVLITDSRDPETGELEPPRIAIHGHLDENTLLLRAEPDYKQKLVAAARNKSELQAWLHGSWDIVAGGMLDDVWDPAHHVLPNVPLTRIPQGWRLNRSLDWGSAKPFSVGWWAESNGEPFAWEGRLIGTVRGDIIRVAEWYGWNGRPNEGGRMLAVDVAEGILDREEDWGLEGRVKKGVADTNIFDDNNGVSVARDMAKKGVSWDPADKGPGSRKQGWEQLRKLLKNGIPPADGEPREEPGLFVMSRCEQWLRTVPVLPRDDKDLDDVDTDAEDHAGDETRYRIRHRPKVAKARSM